MTKKKYDWQGRQGDVLVLHVTGEVTVGQQIAREDGRIVLAHGEATGHAHAIKQKRAKLHEPTDAEALHLGAKVLRVEVRAKLEHEEHAPFAIPVGDNLVVRQQEYSRAEIRNVAD